MAFFPAAGAGIASDVTTGLPKMVSRSAFQRGLPTLSFRVRSAMAVSSCMRNCAGTIGESYILPNNIRPGIINQALMRVRLVSFINEIFYLICFDYAITQSSAQGKGTAIKNIPPFDILKNLLIPLPPLAEQQRIVEAIEKAFEKIKNLEKDEIKLNLLQKSFPKKMKDSLLQAAIQGKLTEQLTSDGDARDLITDIQKEKENLIKEGKIKKETALPEITEDEEQFDIPESWCWVRLGEIITLKSGQDMTPDKYNSINKGIPYITGASNFVDGVLNIDRWTPVPRSIADEGDLLITCKGTVGDMAFLKHSSAHIARQVMAIKPLVGVDIRYIKIYLSFYVNELKSRAKSMIPGISREIILGSLLPLPPFDEQVRIVERLEQLLPLCDSLE